MSEKKPLALIESDPWLEPSAPDIEERYKRYQQKLADIKGKHGSLYDFAGAYKYFGIHYDAVKKGWYYREWAPNARSLHFTGDFNDWNPASHQMHRNEEGYWEIFLDEASYAGTFIHGSRVKVMVEGENGSLLARIPAYIQRVVQDDETKDFAGQLWFEDTFDWNGEAFNSGSLDELYIYECHIGMAQEKEGLGTYTEFRYNILPRIKKAGYNTLQVMAIMEHPYYGSFGYHVSSFFAASSRFGTAAELKGLIKAAHEMGIAVIMDIVHSHAVKNLNEGINRFDGSEGQYFHAGERGEHPDWDSMLFDYGKTDVLKFLLSNIRFWLEEFHFDGYRFDGVGSMMYFHHGNIVFYHPDKYFRDGVEWDAITYLQLANHLAHEINENTVTIAEDVTGMPGLCRPIEEGGIGFNYRLGMGIPDYWIRILKEQKDEEWDIDHLWSVLNDRQPDIKTVAYCESHDQALVGDKTLAFWLMDKEMYFHMHADDDNLDIDRGMALLKLIKTTTISLGGQAYLNFMGNEFGHPEWIDFPREGNNWSYYYCRRQWSLADNPDLKYKFLAEYDRDMISVIKKHKILSQWYATKLFYDDWHKIIAYTRGELLFIMNFHIETSHPEYEFEVAEAGVYRIILNSDAPQYGGHNRINTAVTYPTRFNEETGKYMLRVYIPNRTGLVLKKI